MLKFAAQRGLDREHLVLHAYRALGAYALDRDHLQRGFVHREVDVAGRAAAQQPHHLVVADPVYMLLQRNGVFAYLVGCILGDCRHDDFRGWPLLSSFSTGRLLYQNPLVQFYGYTVLADSGIAIWGIGIRGFTISPNNLKLPINSAEQVLLIYQY